jgi:S-adenosylmethionine hydrolase
MIVLFTDFGFNGPYVGQMKAVLLQQAPDVPTVDLFADAPAFEPQLAAYLLAAYVQEFPPGSVFLCVVDPGVGNAGRRPVMVKVDGRWFVGPDNGLFNVVCLRATRPYETLWWEILWRPEKLSNSFHGRDIFAPVAAQLASHAMPLCRELDPQLCIKPNWPQDLAKIIYIDSFGNAMTGIRANTVKQDSKVIVNAHVLSYARTFSEIKEGGGFWYENSNGLLELAVNQGRADKAFNLHLGELVAVQSRAQT